MYGFKLQSNTQCEKMYGIWQHSNKSTLLQLGANLKHHKRETITTTNLYAETSNLGKRKTHQMRLQSARFRDDGKKEASLFSAEAADEDARRRFR